MVALLSAVGMKAQQQIGDFWYYLNEDLTASLYVYNPSVTYDDEITISSTVEYENKEYTVNAISQWYYPNKRVSLVLPSTITNVSLSCFQSEIGTLTLPATATVDVNGGNNIEAFALSGDNANYSVEDGVLFDKDENTLIAYPRLKDRTSYTVPSTVTAIGRNAFYNNTNIEYLTLPEGLLNIGSNSMRDMSHLNSCNIPSTLKTIGDYAFYGCRLVFEDNTLTLPKTLTLLDQYALYNAFKYASSTTVVLPRELGSDADGGTNFYINERAIQCNSIKSEILKPISVHWNAFNEVQVIFIPDGTKELYLQKDGWNYDSSKLRGGGVSYAETVANVVITDVLDYDNRTVSATLSTETEDAVIRYKIVRSDQGDNSDPTQWDIYDGGTISMVSKSGEYSNYSYTLKAIAFKDEMNSSTIASKIYNYNNYVCSRPTITCADNSTTLTISTSDAEATIYYTTDGSIPTATESETCFKYTGTITLTSNATYKAITAKENAFASEVAERSVTWFPVEPVQTEQVLVDGQPCLKLTTATEGAEIWYSFNWHYEDYRYDKPIPASRNQRIYFMAKKQGLNSTGWNDYTMNYEDYTQCESPSVQMNNETRKVTLSTTEEGADIWYLIDTEGNPNKVPMANTSSGSTKYDGNPFTPWTYGRLKVISAKEGMVNSSVYETGLDDVFRLRYVEFEPILGEEENVYKMGFRYPETDIPGVKIYYYYSGIDWTEYAGTPVNVPANTYVYAQARAQGYVDSYQRDFYVSNDRYVVSQPNITTISQDHKLRITCDTKGVTIYYTTDGTDPTTDSPNHFEISEYYTPDVDVPQNGTYKFMAVKAGMNNSPIASITISDWYRVPRVNIIPFAKDGKMMVKLTCKDEWNFKYYWAYGGNVNYDVITANSEYAMYQDMEIEPNREVYFTAYKDGYQTNWVSKWIYNSDYTCSAPSITINADTIVNMTTNTAGAKIKYTLDESDPFTSWTAKEYSEPFKLDRNYNIKAVTVKDSLFNSSIQTNYYSSFRVANIEFEQVVEKGQPKMKLTTSTPGTTIRYNLNGQNLENSTVYTEPIPMSSGQWIYAIGQKEGYNDSGWQYTNMDYSDYTDFCASASAETDETTRTVTLSTTEPGGEIYYIIDTDGNTNPTRNSTKYDGKPFKPTVNGTLKTIVFAEGKICSDINSYSLNDVFRLRNVTFEPQFEVGEGEDIYNLHFSYRDTTIANLSDVEIWYWKEGTERTKYEGTPVKCTEGSYVYAFARKPGYVDSWQQSIYISKDNYTLRQPQVSMNREKRRLTVTWDDEDATVYYTNDGTDPTSSSINKLDKWWHPDIEVDQNRTYKFITMKDKMISSSVYTVNITDWYYVPEVAIKVFGKDGKLMAKIDCPDAWNYKFYWAYSDNISRDNVTANNEYKEEFEVIDGKYLNATAYKEGYLERWVNSGWIYRSNYMCSQPSIVVNEEKSVTISSNTVGATIKYTLDDSDPETSSTALVYTEPFTINRNYTIKAVAMKDSLLTSNIASNNYSSFRVADIAFEQVLEDGQPKMKITTETEGATILYSFNGYDRNNSIKYSGPVAMRSGRWIYATAVKDGFNDASWREQYFDTSEYEDRCSQPNLEGNNDLRLITLTTSEEGGEIYYVIDTEGNKYPTKNDTKYDGNPFKPTVYGTLKAVVFKEDKVCSDIAEFDIGWAFRLRDVTFEPQIELKDAEELKEGEDVYKYKMHFSYRDTTVANNDIEIYYWYSGEEQKKYDGTPIDIELGSYIYAKVKKPGYIDSWEREMYINQDSYTLRQPNVNARSESKKLIVTWDDEDAKVYWTDNGEDPTATNGKSLDKYNNTDIDLTHNGTYKFIAMKDKMLNSPITTVTINDWFRVPQVKIVPYGDNDKFMAKLECEGYNNIYWAYEDEVVTDAVVGNNPYTGPIEVIEGKRIYATAWKEGYNENWTSSDWLYKNNYTCTVPTIAINRDTIVTITNNQAGSKIRYTLDGSDPTIYTGNEYAEPFKLLNNATIKAIAYKDSLLTSSVRSQQYSGYRVAGVTISTYIENNQIMAKLETKTPDAKIYYNFNERNNVVTGNLLYSAPFVVADGYRVQANAVKDGYTDAGWTSTDWLNYASYTATQPIITIMPDTTVFMSADTGAEIRYTLDGTTPTANSSKYTTTIKLTRNSQIRAIAIETGKINSAVTENNYNGFRVQDVNFSFFAQGNSLMAELSCENKDATIYYKIGDGYNAQDITASPNVKYTAPFAVSENRRIWASAAKDGYNNANWKYVEGVTKAAYTATMPDIGTDESGKVSITGEKDATFYYTTNNTTPTTNSTLYKEPFAVNQNDTIKAIAVVDRKFNSSVTTYYYTAYRVNPVTIKPVVLDNVLKMELSTTTPDATIYYGINSHNARASANVRYTAPFAVRDGDVVYASAAKNGYQDAVWIELDNISVKDYTCSQPQIAVDADGVVSIASDAGATIYYTLNEATPTVASTKYTGSFQLTRNATIKAFATMNGMINSAVTQYVHDRFRVEAPVFAQEGIMMTITTTTPDATIYYSYESEGNTLNTNSHKYTEPFPVMDNSMLRAYAVREGWFDSDINTINTGDKIACPMVEAVSYDGHFLTLKTIEDATIWYTTNGNDPRDNSNNTVNWIYEYKTPIAINSTGEIKAIATKNYMNPSEIATFDINFYAGENGTKLEKSGVLEEVMAWSDPSTITEFDIEGPLNQADLAFIKNSMTALQHLDMSKTTIEDGVLPDNAFSGLPIVSFTSPENITQVGNGIFTDCPELAAVRWNTTTKLPDNSFDANHNPNLLLFVRFEIASPSHTAVANQIINGTAQSIVLVDDYASNFYCPEQFYAKSIKYTHKFTMTSGNGGGWESFALPFTPTRFIHESKGELLPFMSYEQQENKEAYRPFWLRSLNELGFEDATTMEANKPYIICMPNNERYATRFRLAGNVTFSATDTYVPVTNPESAEKGNVMFVPNFMHRDKEAGILAINLETVDEFLPGSAFLENVRGLRPFEAYARSIGVSRQAIRIDDADLATAIQDTQLIDVSGNAIIKVYNLSGNLVITGKRSEVMPKLADGVYIIDGKKIAVK